MIHAGDIHLADLIEERRRRVLVISNDRFHRASGRALVAPQIIGEPDEVPFPWRVQVDDGVYAIDLVRSLPVDRLLDRIDRAPARGNGGCPPRTPQHHLTCHSRLIDTQLSSAESTYERRLTAPFPHWPPRHIRLPPPAERRGP